MSLLKCPTKCKGILYPYETLTALPSRDTSDRSLEGISFPWQAPVPAPPGGQGRARRRGWLIPPHIQPLFLICENRVYWALFHKEQS